MRSPTRTNSHLGEFEDWDLGARVKDRVLPELLFVDLPQIFKVFNDFETFYGFLEVSGSQLFMTYARFE